MENLLGLYSKYWLPFGELLTDIERRGISVNVDYLKQIQLTAEKDKINFEEAFLQWVYKVQPDCSEFNPNSVQQMQQLLFAPFNKKGKLPTEEQLKESNYQWDFPPDRSFVVENSNNTIKEGQTRVLKKNQMIVRGMGIKIIDFTASGLPACDTPVIKQLAGSAPSKGKYGLAYDHFKALGQEQVGIEMCLALENWYNFKSIETLL